MSWQAAARVASVLASSLSQTQQREQHSILTAILAAVGAVLLILFFPVLLLVSGGAAEDLALQEGIVDADGHLVLQHYEGIYGSGLMVLPCNAILAVTDDFGWRLHPIFGQMMFHEGVDLAADYNTPVLAAAPGVVTVSAWDGGYGYVVEIDHSGGLVTRYAHMAGLGVPVGTLVKPGDGIGLVGSTGNSTGPHLHFEVLQDGAQVDPGLYIDIGDLPR